MDKFWDLLDRSVIVQGVTTLVLVGACVYLCVVGQPIPELLGDATMLALGFYFGTKVQHDIHTLSKK